MVRAYDRRKLWKNGPYEFSSEKDLVENLVGKLTFPLYRDAYQGVLQLANLWARQDESNWRKMADRSLGLINQVAGTMSMEKERKGFQKQLKFRPNRL